MIRHAGPDTVETFGKYTFAFVRHPLSFYRSLWSYKMRFGWDMNNPFDNSVAHDTYQLFLHAVVEKCPGWYTRLCKGYLGQQFNALDFVGKQEYLVDDVMRALTAAGESFREEDIRSVLPKNRSIGVYASLQETRISVHLAQRVLLTEKEMMDACDYVGIPDESLISF